MGRSGETREGFGVTGPAQGAERGDLELPGEAYRGFWGAGAHRAPPLDGRDFVSGPGVTLMFFCFLCRLVVLGLVLRAVIWKDSRFLGE